MSWAHRFSALPSGADGRVHPYRLREFKTEKHVYSRTACVLGHPWVTLEAGSSRASISKLCSPGTSTERRLARRQNHFTNFRRAHFHSVYFLVPKTTFTALLPFSVPTVTMTVRLLLSLSAESTPPEDVAVSPAKFAPIVNPASFRPFS